MEIDVQTVRHVFEEMLAGRISRQEADRWAYSVIQHEEAGNLIYSPPSDKDRIWSGVMYLYGVDLMESPDEYLHTDEDIKTAMKLTLRLYTGG
ncbi:hypothetical protein [Caballeronia sp. LZ035]|uniref:hypothetical protein n=1 Tax=Caballeronia sp. LZ035 TaxID=3038568 RepID=UPI002856064E|nr:hypothetical protein [Caballeronia sp. LZ035]MDR5758550.1 hypothetical protein [Caballeronia sp. LZ035]